MSRNITVSEGQQGRNFGPTRKLETDLQGGGTQYWIPEEEANDYADTEEITITENGTYSPGAGIAAFSRVIVNTPFKLGKLTARQAGEYNAATFGLSGFSEVMVDVYTSMRTGSASVTANGTYLASSYELDGFSTFTVNVPSIVGDGYTVENDTNEGLVLVYDSTNDLSGIHGSSVDTSGGNLYVVTVENGAGSLVEVTPEGAVTKTAFPDSLEIVTPPTKTSYTVGESINYAGISVRLSCGGSPYTCTAYPTGVVPFSELTFPVSAAPAGSGGTAEIPVWWVTPSGTFPLKTTLKGSFEIEVTSA